MIHQQVINFLKARLNTHVKVILPDPLPQGLFVEKYEPIYGTGETWVITETDTRDHLITLLYDQSQHEIWKATGLDEMSILLCCNIAVINHVYEKIHPPK